MKPDVAIIIVTYNSEDHIQECLRSVLEQRQEVSQEIIVLDNQSQDQTVAIVREKFPSIKLLRPGKNLGFAAGVNYAARHAKAEMLLLLNPDTVIVNHAVDVVVGFARANPTFGLYGGRTLKPDGSLDPSSCWGEPTLWSTAMFGMGLSTLFRRNRLFDPESLGGWARNSVREVGVVTGCFLLVSRSIWNKLGGFDERYFMYGEDVDLAMRARAAGHHPVICPDAEIVHWVGKSSALRSDKMLMLLRGKATLFRSHWSGLRLWFGLKFLSLGIGLRAAVWSAVSLFKPLKEACAWKVGWQNRCQWLQGYVRRDSQSDEANGIEHAPCHAEEVA